MNLNLSSDDLQQIKEQLIKTQQTSHLIIFKSVSPESGGILHMITNYDAFETIKKQRPALQMQIVRDIVPVTDNLAYWAVAQNMASQLASNADQNYENQTKAALKVEKYTNLVLAENKLPQNK
jgi:hypothetical protein